MPGWKLDFSMCLKKGTLETEWVEGHSLVEWDYCFTEGNQRALLTLLS